MSDLLKIKSQFGVARHGKEIITTMADQVAKLVEKLAALTERVEELEEAQGERYIL